MRNDLRLICCCFRNRQVFRFGQLLFLILFLMDVITMFMKFWLGSVKIIHCLGSKFRGVELIRMMKI